jgi:excisionase family DNA binding protein
MDILLAQGDPMMNEKPRSVRQAAEELNLSTATIRAWLASRKLGYVRLGRAIRIPADEIRRLLTEGMVPARVDRYANR